VRSQEQDVVSKEVRDYKEFGNVESVEFYKFLETGTKSLSYIYWDSSKYVFHLNPTWSLDKHVDVECSIGPDIMEHVNAEFFETMLSLCAMGICLY